MAVLTFPNSTEAVRESLVTYIFAMGDSRFYTRVSFPGTIVDPATSIERPTTVGDMIATGVAMAAETESILLATTVSLSYEDDETQIPAGDSGGEYSYYILIRSEKHPVTHKDETWQIRIPNLHADFDAAAWVEANKNVLFSPTLGMRAKKMVSANAKQDRKARGSV